MGMRQIGGYRPKELEWKWDENYTDNMVWLGKVDAGMQLNLLRPRDMWTRSPKKAGFPLPASWANDGKGGCTIKEIGDNVLVNAYSGSRQLKAGEEIEYRFRLSTRPMLQPGRPHQRKDCLEHGDRYPEQQRTFW